MALTANTTRTAKTGDTTPTQFPLVVGKDGSGNDVHAVTVLGATSEGPIDPALDASVLAMSGKLPAVLGPQAVNASLSVTPATSSTFAISAASLPLPSGAAADSTISTMSGKLPATLGQKAASASMSVTVANDQSAVPISVASLPLPTGAAADSTLSAMSGKLPATLGQHAAAASMSVVLASDDTILGPVTETAPATDTASSGLNGRLQRIAQRISSLIALLPTSLGQKAATQSMAVVLPSDTTRGVLQTATTSTSPAYSVNDAIGGKLTFATMTRITGGRCTLTGLSVMCKSVSQTPTISVLVFKGSPTATTATDNAAFSFADADVTRLVDQYDVTLGAIIGSTRTRANITFAQSVQFEGGNADLTVILVLKAGAYTAGSTTDLEITLFSQAD